MPNGFPEGSEERNKSPRNLHEKKAELFYEPCLARETLQLLQKEEGLMADPDCYGECQLREAEKLMLSQGEDNSVKPTMNAF